MRIYQKSSESNKEKKDLSVINHPPEPKLVQLDGWEEQELFSDRLDKGF